MTNQSTNKPTNNPSNKNKQYRKRSVRKPNNLLVGKTEKLPIAKVDLDGVDAELIKRLNKEDLQELCSRYCITRIANEDRFRKVNTELLLLKESAVSKNVLKEETFFTRLNYWYKDSSLYQRLFAWGFCGMLVSLAFMGVVALSKVYIFTEIIGDFEGDQHSNFSSGMLVGAILVLIGLSAIVLKVLKLPQGSNQ